MPCGRRPRWCWACRPSCCSGSPLGGMIPNPRAATEEEAKQQGDEAIGSTRKRFEELKAATLETSKRLRQERRRVAELEGRLGQPQLAAPATPEIERRLRDVEQKLDQVLKVLEN